MRKPPFRHIVNFGLLFSFITLAVTGVMSFALPFSLSTSRAHIIFGAATILLIAMHLLGRLAYFKGVCSPKENKKSSMPLSLFVGISVIWGSLLAGSFYGVEPIKALMKQSYEAKHRADIIRPSAMSGFMPPEGNVHLIGRIPERNLGEKGAIYAVGMQVRLNETEGEIPVMAIWAETRSGAMIETLYIDSRLAYSADIEWGGVTTARHHILPIWRHKHTSVSGIDPNGEVDAVSSATPTHTFSLDNYLVLGEEKSFNICIEVSLPHDVNENYPDVHLGQPSILYTAYIEIDEEKKYHLLELTGHGNNDAERGIVQYDLTDITTAKDILDLSIVSFTPYVR
jgi:hypothetical protein